MDFSRENVLAMVDALFHEYASSYRAEAMESVKCMMDSRETRSPDLPTRLRELAEELDNLDTRELGDYAYRIHMKSDITDPLRELAATLTQVKEGE